MCQTTSNPSFTTETRENQTTSNPSFTTETRENQATINQVLLETLECIKPQAIKSYYNTVVDRTTSNNALLQKRKVICPQTSISSQNSSAANHK